MDAAQDHTQPTISQNIGTDFSHVPIPIQWTTSWIWWPPHLIWRKTHQKTSEITIDSPILLVISPIIWCILRFFRGPSAALRRRSFNAWETWQRRWTKPSQRRPAWEKWGKPWETLGNYNENHGVMTITYYNYGISEKFGTNGETMTIQWLGSASELHVSILFSKINGEPELRIELLNHLIDEQMMCFIFRSAKIEVY